MNRPLMALLLPPKLLRLLARSPLATDNSSSRFPAPDVSPVSVLSQLVPATGKPAHNSTSHAGISFYFVLYMQLPNFSLGQRPNKYSYTPHINNIFEQKEKKDHRRLTRNDYESQLFRVLGLPFPGHSKALPASAVHLEHCPIWTRLVGFVGSFRGFLRYTRELSSMRAPTSSTRNDRAKRRAEAEAEQGA